MCRVNSPPVVGKDVEDAQHNNEKRGRPLGFEPNSYHDARGKANNRNKDADKAPFSLENKPKEKENEENSASKKETE